MKRIILIMALAASSAFAEHVYPVNPSPGTTAFFGQLGRDSTVITNPTAFVSVETDPAFLLWLTSRPLEPYAKTEEVAQTYLPKIVTVGSQVVRRLNPNGDLVVYDENGNDILYVLSSYDNDNPGIYVQSGASLKVYGTRNWATYGLTAAAAAKANAADVYSREDTERIALEAVASSAVTNGGAKTMIVGYLNGTKIAIGSGSSSGTSGVAVGPQSGASYFGTSLGYGAKASGMEGIAIGANAKVDRSEDQAIVIGSDAISHGSHTLSFGSGVNTLDQVWLGSNKLKTLVDAEMPEPYVPSADDPVFNREVTTIVREHSGDYWDEELQVWWTGRMSGGKLTYMATTNVNLNAEH